MKRAWYLGARPDQVADRCVLVGDPGRVDLFAERLDGAELVNVGRGLRTVTGRVDGRPVTVAAFGMGAPIAVIVLEELAALGARVFLRAGTAMSLGDLMLGSFMVGLAGMRNEGTSQSYAPSSYPAVADFHLTQDLVHELRERGLEHAVGIIASDDGFYNRLFSLNEGSQPSVAQYLAELRRLHVQAADMETAALLTAGATLGVHAGSLCLLTVDATTRAKLEPPAMEIGEGHLVEVALHVVATTSCGGAIGSPLGASAVTRG